MKTDFKNQSYFIILNQFHHCLYDGEEEVYKHCKFEKGLDTCRDKSNDKEPEPDDNIDIPGLFPDDNC